MEKIDETGLKMFKSLRNKCALNPFFKLYWTVEFFRQVIEYTTK